MNEARTDRDLLRDYVERGSESAFQALVGRHVNLVFATALRGVNNTPAAQEVTQNVFIALARKARWLRQEATLAGWLHKTARFEVHSWWRGELRRRRREQTAVELHTTMKDDDSLLKSLAGALDDGLLELRAADRQALLLRYFEERSHREIATILGLGEDAVRKRLDKALDQLTAYFRRRGYAVPVAAATAAALRAAAQTAPAGVSAMAAQAGLSAGGAVSAGGFTLLLARFMALTKTQTAVVCALLAAAPVWFQWRALNDARTEQYKVNSEVAALRQGIAARQGEVSAVERRIGAASQALADLKEARAGAERGGTRPAETASLYRWDEQSEYVRLPKGLAPHLTFAGFEMQPRGRAPAERVQLPALAKDGTPSAVLLDALGLSSAEAEQVSQAVRDAFTKVSQIAAGQSYVTNQTYFPDGRLSGCTLVIPAIGEEGVMIEQSLWDSLTQSMGEERAQLFWQQAGTVFRDSLNEFGAAQKNVQLQAQPASSWLTMHEQYFQTNGAIRLDASRNINKLDGLPEALLPYAQTMQTVFQPQSGDQQP
jgi:RNA polymerase sigma factor (sigma-70 family)